MKGRIHMTKKQEAKQILKCLGMPTKQQGDICCYSLLALLGIGRSALWSSVTNEWIRIHDILAFIKTNYRVRYAENSRETFRKEAMHHFRTAAIIEDNGVATNSPNYRYRVTVEALALFKSFGTDKWAAALAKFLVAHQSLQEIYASKKKVAKVAVCVDGVDYDLSTGAHNLLQKAVIEEYAPRFAKGAKCLYLGDTQKRDLIKNIATLSALGFEISLHDKMPDIVLYIPQKKWLYFIECVTSVGPMSPARLLEIKQMTKGVRAGKIYVTAFPNRKLYAKFFGDLAWETDAWIASDPDHLVHMNGDRFMGPRKEDA